MPSAPFAVAFQPSSLQDCLICLTPMGSELSALPCGHVYHFQCIETVLAHAGITKGQCPSCRRPFASLIKLFFTFPGEAVRFAVGGVDWGRSGVAAAEPADSQVELLQYLQGRVNFLEAELQRVQDECEAAEEKAEELFEDNEGLRLEVGGLAGQLEANRRLLAEQVDCGQVERARLLQRIAQLSSDLAAAEKTSGSFKDQLNQFRSLQVSQDLQHFLDEIDVLQQDAHVQRLRSPQVPKAEVIDLLLGMKARLRQQSLVQRDLERQLRGEKIRCEQLERRQRRVRGVERAQEDRVPASVSVVAPVPADSIVDPHEHGLPRPQAHRPSTLKRPLSLQVPRAGSTGGGRAPSTDTSNGSLTVQNGRGAAGKTFRFPDGSQFMF